MILTLKSLVNTTSFRNVSYFFYNRRNLFRDSWNIRDSWNLKIETALYSRKSYSFHFSLIFRDLWGTISEKSFCTSFFGVFSHMKNSHTRVNAHKNSPHNIRTKISPIISYYIIISAIVIR